jgi:hypothetical protein
MGEEGSITAVPQSDLYQLGLLLWRIASENYSLRPIFYQAADCTTKSDMACTDPHTDQFQLPKIGEPVPGYLEKIIAACRNKNPNKRPPAWKLLEMFPPMTEVNINPKKAMITNDTPQHSFSTSAEQSTVQDCLVRNYFVSPEECYKKYYQAIECDICGRRTSEHFFHCSICESGDFDLCPQCFSQGVRCLDPDHFLREISVGITKDISEECK